MVRLVFSNPSLSLNLCSDQVWVRPRIQVGVRELEPKPDLALGLSSVSCSHTSCEMTAVTVCRHGAHMHMPGATATAIAAATACTSARQGYMCARTHRAEGASCTCSNTNSHARSAWRARALALAYTCCRYTKTELHLLYHSRQSKAKTGWR